MPAASPFAPSPAFFFAAFACAFAVYWYAAVEGRVAFTLPKILALGLFVRLLLLPMPPGDDMARYLWEGRILLAGENPYRLAPDHPDLIPLRDASWEAINHKDIPALYPPLALGLFAALAALADGNPSPILFKGAFILLDVLGLLALLFALKGGRGNMNVTSAPMPAAPLRAAAVYFLNPLLAFESAGNGHYESLPLLASLAFLALVKRGHGIAAVPCLVVAALCKVSALALLPLLVLARPGRAGWLLALAAAVPAGAALQLSGSFGTLVRFANDFHYNDCVPFLLRAVSGGWLPADLAGWASRVLLAASGLYLLRRLRGEPPERQALAFTGLLLAFSPTLHPWYALWILPFAALCLSRPWLLFTGTAAAAYGAYAAAGAAGRFREIPWLRLPEFLPPLLLALLARLRSGRR